MASGSADANLDDDGDSDLGVDPSTNPFSPSGGNPATMMSLSQSDLVR